MPEDLLLFKVQIPGKPRTQGSMTLARDPRTGREFARYSTETRDHRNLAVDVVRQAWAGRDPIRGPVGLQCEFRFARPQGHYGTGRNAGLLRASAPLLMNGHVDVDKLVRLIGDTLVIGGVLGDDDQIVRLYGEKVWAAQSGTDVEIWRT